VDVVLRLDTLETMPASAERDAAVQSLYQEAFAGMAVLGGKITLPAWMKGVPCVGEAKGVSSLRAGGLLSNDVFQPVALFLRQTVHQVTGQLLFCYGQNTSPPPKLGSHWVGLFYIGDAGGEPVSGSLTTSYYFDSLDANAEAVLSATRIPSRPGDMEKARVSFDTDLQPLRKAFKAVGNLKQKGQECGVLVVMAMRVVAGSLLLRNGTRAARSAADELDRVLPLPKSMQSGDVTADECHAFRQHLAMWYIGRYVFLKDKSRVSERAALRDRGPYSLAYSFCYRADQAQSMQEYLAALDDDGDGSGPDIEAIT
jgi:hypothetical protein